MSAEYNFATSFSTAAGTARFNGSLPSPSECRFYLDTAGIGYMIYIDVEGFVKYVRITNGSGAVQSSLLGSNTLYSKSLAANVDRLEIYRDASGIVYVVYDDPSNNRVGYFAISGTDGVVYTNQTTLTNSTIYLKTVGTNPRNAFVYRDTAGIVYFASADVSSNRVSYFAISGTDGVVYTNQTTLNGSTLYTKTSISSAQVCVFYRDTAGIVYAVYSGSSGRGYFAISGTDGVVYTNQTTLDASTIYTKNSTNSGVLFVYRDTAGSIYAIYSASNNISYFPISGTNGVIYTNQTTLTNATIYTKAVTGGSSRFDIYTNPNGFIWAISAGGTNQREILLVELSDRGGALYTNQTTLTGKTVYSKVVGQDWNDWTKLAVGTSGDFFVIYTNTVNRIFGVISITPIVYQLSLITPPSSYFVVADNIAEVTASTSYFALDGGLAQRLFVVSYAFPYTRLTASSMILGSGTQLRFINSTSDIVGGQITVSSGATVRLGKKSTQYSAEFFFQSGSTIEVYPDSDRSGNPVDLSNQAINSGTTINVTSGTATVLVSSSAGITAGAGVTLQAPHPPITITTNPLGARVGVYRQSDNFEILNINSNGTTGIASTSYSGSVPVSVIVRVRLSGYKPSESIQTITTSGLTLSVTLERDIADNIAD